MNSLSKHSLGVLSFGGFGSCYYEYTLTLNGLHVQVEELITVALKPILRKYNGKSIHQLIVEKPVVQLLPKGDGLIWVPPETRLTMCDLRVTHFMCARNSLFNTMYTTTAMPL
jgi:hypothetical protein